ncbi:hypothetical protein LXD69_09745 [Flavobacterium sediminilitoris]|uniref:Sugar transporter n=1 Tax=Flavobacterium sediminilitoris TaxID=2024526 RepID=A0ABY4HID5_9FLAO|nr:MULTISPECIES: hypothetical protein [Flavobacterium]UOX32333.1 hypothetical protein LXD69_09745 [Flavobacterium sediminilitoris]
MTKPSKSFWIISILALIWNLMGVNQYLQQAYNTESFKAMYNEEQLQAITNTPSWAIAAFAVAVFSAVLGCISLLLRKKWAQFFFGLSLLGVIIQMYHNLFVIKSIAVYGPGAMFMTILILIVALFLYWYSKFVQKKNWVS